MIRDVDAVVVGSGQGGVPLAIALANEGKHVVLFERGRFGGTCINTGCTPSKAFLAAAHSVGRARRARALGLDGEVTLDFPFVMERVRGIVAAWSMATRMRLEGAGVEIVRAEASFMAERTLEGSGVAVRAPVVVIDTGGAAAIPPIDGLRDVPYFDNASFFSQRSLPRRLLVLGGGYIGLELGQGMARAGSEVHIVHPKTHVLDNEEFDASAVLEDALREDGVRLHLGARAVSARMREGEIVVGLADGAELGGDALLVATGRKPNSAALRCDRAGIAVDERGYIRVDEQLRTTAEGVFALGDVARQPAFTHVSWEDHRRVLGVLHGELRSRDDRVLGYSTFTEPQIARAGLTLEQAKARGYDALAVTLPLHDVARAVEWNEERGFYRLVVDRRDDRIIGATLVGYEAAELVHVFIAHIEAGSTWHRLADSVHIHPTFGEGLPSLARLVASTLQAEAAA
ncbi:MAG TPA: FAD-dependent oxidoreductase [Candidatus Acidoferrum sp.]|nr:FAD-dependent oxidoreductase [Candidatus Acidoferrum sp.]